MISTKESDMANWMRNVLVADLLWSDQNIKIHMAFPIRPQTLIRLFIPLNMKIRYMLQELPPRAGLPPKASCAGKVTLYLTGADDDRYVVSGVKETLASDS